MEPLAWLSTESINHRHHFIIAYYLNYNIFNYIFIIKYLRNVIIDIKSCILFYFKKTLIYIWV